MRRGGREHISGKEDMHPDEGTPRSSHGLARGDTGEMPTQKWRHISPSPVAVGGPPDHILGVSSKNIAPHFEYQVGIKPFISSLPEHPYHRPRDIGQTATSHLSAFSSGGRSCMPAGGSDLPGLHQECAPYPINRPYHGKASLGVISGLPRPFQAIGCHLRPHLCHTCRKISGAWPI